MLIDFSVVAAALNALEVCRIGNKPVVIGVTGFSAEQCTTIEQAAKDIPVLFAPNMSLGVNLCLRALQQISQMLSQLASSEVFAEVDIIEKHHRYKVDSLLELHLRISKLIAEQLGLPPQAIVTQQQNMPIPRDHNTLAVHSLRAGHTVGEHTVVYTLEGERIELTHRTFSRRAYASGALCAATVLHDCQPGLYDMQAVIDASLV